MPLYVCEKCNCVDNTALDGNYWQSRKCFSKSTEIALCSECYSGKWHNKFDKVNFNDEPYNGKRSSNFCDINNIEDLDIDPNDEQFDSVNKVLKGLDKNKKISKLQRKFIRRNKRKYG